MIKKIALISLFVVFTGVLVAGGVYRTAAKSASHSLQEARNTAALLDGDETAAQPQGGRDSEHQGQGLGSGGVAQGRNQKTEVEPGFTPSGGLGAQSGQGNRGQGQGGSGRYADEEGTAAQSGEGYQGGQGRSQQGERSYEAEDHELVAIEGTVTQVPAAGVDMVVSTGSGQVLVGTGPGYLQEMGFELREGETVQVVGFWEDGEFKPESITRDGEKIDLRDQFGRPMWSGAARGGQSGQGNQGSGRQARDGSAQADL